MSSSTDYYNLLGVEPDASPGEIKAAFKKLALQYHPDVYKGADAQERMRLLLRAYQTLNDAQARREYDAQRREPGVRSPSSQRGSGVGAASSKNRRGEVSPRARRDRQRHYDFSDLNGKPPINVQLGHASYSLLTEQVRTLRQEGMLRGVEQADMSRVASAPGQSEGRICYCHRCRHRWTPDPAQARLQSGERTCPSCHASDWREYLLLRCIHCCAIFESEQIRYRVGDHNYGDGDLCPPYELFPLCPYCGSAHWCPAEDARVSKLREAAARHAAIMRLVWLGVVAAAVLILGVLLLTTLWH
ncbi:MAG: DnaJ domain-containing protein [Chloroflexota bacterium]|nr:DnaJ domain-containing protein [Chloroflexota bacterium]